MSVSKAHNWPWRDKAKALLGQLLECRHISAEQGATLRLASEYGFSLVGAYTEQSMAQIIIWGLIVDGEPFLEVHTSNRLEDHPDDTILKVEPPLTGLPPSAGVAWGSNLDWG